jgi:formylglycine-generating enzyme required for sulfatase activity
MKYILLILFFSTSTFAAESLEFAKKVVKEHNLKEPESTRLTKILTTMPSSTRNIGTEDLDAVQGPNNSWHPASRAQCVNRVIKTGIIKPNSEYEKVCGAKWMSPVPDENGNIHNSKVCIDQFEFPNMPCEYPVVWAPASTAKSICESMGKRVCNSHEWEGACAGRTDERNPYLFNLSSLQDRRVIYNKDREISWAFSWNSKFRNVTDTRELCGVYSLNDPDFDPYLQNGKAKNYYIPIGKSKECHSGSSDYKSCGTNTWPAGFKHLCVSRYDVYDLHGNVAEVTNFPRTEKGLARVGNTDRTERKGSFFVQRSGYPDDCRVRQPYEHFNEFATDKHSYYQEGFRCCKDN